MFLIMFIINWQVPFIKTKADGDGLQIWERWLPRMEVCFKEKHLCVDRMWHV